MNGTEINILIGVNSGFAVIGCLASLSAVILIVITGAHHQYVYRLQLYLAIISLLFAAALGFETLPVEVRVDPNGTATLAVREGWADACVAIGYIAQYLGFAKAFCVLWICTYVFMVAVYQRQLRQLRHEVVGLALVLTLPTSIAWIPIIRRSYGLDGVWCWVKTTSDYVTTAFLLGLSNGFTALLHMVGLILLFTAVFKLGKWFFITKDDAVQLPYRIVLKEVLPLTVYPSIYSIANLISATKSIYDVATHSSGEHSSTANEMAVICVLQIFVVALPLSILLHPRIRESIRHRCWKTDSFGGYVKYSRQTSLTNEPNETQSLVTRPLGTK